ncbi:MAG TPA: hypothetical protein VK629_20270 [Steroidobacteraceae bacterium]|nr:hypothetical protein [Steroidobacteraceae bacterium]
MATFKTLNWSTLDTWAIVTGRGVVPLLSEDHHAAGGWLQQHNYEMLHLDFTSGISRLVGQLGTLLGWSSQFGVGHELHPESRNLDALRDGFTFKVPEQGGLALTLQGFEQAWSEDQRWSAGFLSIISEFSLQQLALGRRFFAVIEVANPSSVLVGAQFEIRSIGHPFQRRPEAF